VGSGSHEHGSSFKVVVREKKVETRIMHEHCCGQMKVFCAQTEQKVVAACYSSSPAHAISPVAFPTTAWCSRCESPVLALCDIRLKRKHSSPFVVVSETTRERDPSCVREPLPTTRVHTCHKEKASFSSTHTQRNGKPTMPKENVVTKDQLKRFFTKLSRLSVRYRKTKNQTTLAGGSGQVLLHSPSSLTQDVITFEPAPATKASPV
jgi:hypothetical protein